MARSSEGRGWRKWMPSKYTVVKVFVSLIAIKIVSQFVYRYTPPSIAPYLPNVT